jgi:folate-binding protein YgfZ
MLQRSPLYECQKDSGASFTNLFGWEIADTFRSLNEEYEILRHAVGLLDCSQSGVFEVRGDDRTRFLHGMLTNDIKQLRPGNGCYAGFLTPQGRLIGDMRVYCLEDSLLITVEPSLRSKVPLALGKYIIGGRPELIDRSQDLSILALQGRQPFRLLEEISPGIRPFDQPFDHHEQDVLGITVRICHVNCVLDDRYDLIVPTNRLIDLWKKLIETERGVAHSPVGFSALNIRRVEAGIPWYEFDMDEKTLPLEAGLEKNAISLTKGCYIGQESVARITYRGQVQRKLAGLIITGDIVAAKGDRVFKEEQEMGWVTSNVFSIALNCPIALGYLRRDAFEVGTVLRIEHSGMDLGATVSSLPFISVETVS